MFCSGPLGGGQVIWADRVAIVWGALICVLYFAGGLTSDATWQVALVYVLLPWGLLRGLDWIISGGLRWRPTPPRGNSP